MPQPGVRGAGMIHEVDEVDWDTSQIPRISVQSESSTKSEGNMVQECPEGLRLDQELARAVEAARSLKNHQRESIRYERTALSVEDFLVRLEQIRYEQFEAERALNGHIAEHHCMPQRKS